MTRENPNFLEENPLSDTTEGRGRFAFCLAVGVVVLAGFLANFTRVWNADTFWQLACGEWTLRSGEILDHNFFSTDADRSWINVHWLFQVIMASLHRLGGFELLSALKAVGGAVALLLVALAGRRRTPAWWVILVGLLALVVMTGRVRVRPELFTLCFLAATVLLLESAQQTGRTARLWWLAPMQLLWVNMHGLFILGPFLFLAVVGGELAMRFVAWLRKTPPKPAVFLRLRALPPLAAVLAVCFATPWPMKVVWQPFLLWTRVSGNVEAYSYGVTEFIPAWGEPANHKFAIALLAATLTAMCLNVRRTTVAHWLWLAAFGILAAKARRNTALLGAVCGPLLIWHGGQWLHRFIPPPRRRNVGALRFGTLGMVASVLLALLVGAGYATEWFYRRSGAPYHHFGPGLLVQRYPIAAAQFLRNLPAEGDVLCENFADAGAFMYYSDPNTGGVALKKPARRVYMDGRLEAHTRERFQRLQTIRQTIGTPRGAARVDLPSGVRFLFVSHSRPEPLIALSLSDRFRLLHVSQAGALFARTDWPGRPNDWPAKANLDEWNRPPPSAKRVWWRQNPDSILFRMGYVFLHLGMHPAETGPVSRRAYRTQCIDLAVRYLAAARAEGIVEPHLVHGTLGLAHIQAFLYRPIFRQGERNDLDEALDCYDQIDLTRLDDENIRTFAVQRGFALLLNGRVEDARTQLRDILAGLPKDVRPQDMPSLTDLQRELR